MKIKSLVACLIISPLMYSMYDPEVSPHIHTKPDIPQITIEQCSQCNKPAAQQCSLCKLTFYCSQECQFADWNNHKAHCNQLQKAHRGHIELMRHVFSAYIDKAIETREQKYVHEALAWHRQTIIRIAQDKACAHDDSILPLTVELEAGYLLEKLTANKICSSTDLRTMLGRAQIDAVAKVRQLTIDDKLVPPYGVRRYGNRSSRNAKRAPDEFIPQEEWKGKRLAVITEIAEHIAFIAEPESFDLNPPNADNV